MCVNHYDDCVLKLPGLMLYNDAFCKRLEGLGVTLDVPYTKGPSGLGTARLTDPWGTSIELTEGLGGI